MSSLPPIRVPTAQEILAATTGAAKGQSGSADIPVRLARIDPAYTPWTGYPNEPPLAKVTFEGEGALSGKLYPYVNGYIPQPNDRVWMVPIGTTWLICGRADPQTAQGFWQNAAGSASGTEFGNGSYFDSTTGLNIAGGATLSGDLSVGGIGRQIKLVKTADTDRTTALADDPHLTLASLPIGEYVVDAWLNFQGLTSGKTDTDMAIAWNMPATSSYRRYPYGPDASVAGFTGPFQMQSTTTKGSWSFGCWGNGQLFAWEHLYFRTTAAGLFALQFGRAVGTDTVRLQVDSHVLIRRIG